MGLVIGTGPGCVSSNTFGLQYFLNGVYRFVRNLYLF